MYHRGAYRNGEHQEDGRRRRGSQAGQERQWQEVTNQREETPVSFL